MPAQWKEPGDHHQQLHKYVKPSSRSRFAAFVLNLDRRMWSCWEKGGVHKSEWMTGRMIGPGECMSWWVIKWVTQWVRERDNKWVSDIIIADYWIRFFQIQLTFKSLKHHVSAPFLAFAIGNAPELPICNNLTLKIDAIVANRSPGVREKYKSVEFNCRELLSRAFFYWLEVMEPTEKSKLEEKYSAEKKVTEVGLTGGLIQWVTIDGEIE